MVSKTVFGIAAGIAGSLVIGYCIYFDRKRRSDPLFWQRLKERREKQKQKENTKKAASGDNKQTIQLPNLKDPESVQRFFLAQVQHGEELLAEGEIELGTECLCNAVAVCGQPDHLLQVLQQTLPSQVYNLLIHKLPEASEKLSASLTASVGVGLGPSTSALVDDDLE